MSLLSVLAPEAFPSPPATFQECRMNHNHVAHLPAKFFSSATTASSSQAAASSGCPLAKTTGRVSAGETGLHPSILPSLPPSPPRKQAGAALATCNRGANRTGGGGGREGEKELAGSRNGRRQRGRGMHGASWTQLDPAPHPPCHPRHAPDPSVPWQHVSTRLLPTRHVSSAREQCCEAT